MLEYIENVVSGTLSSEAQENACSFIRNPLLYNLEFEHGTGYWADKPYWMVKCKGEYVCFLFIHGSPAKYEGEPEGWIVWSDDSDSGWYSDVLLDELMKEIAWANVDICGKCSPNSPCFGGSRKTICGRIFDNVCRTTFRFDNPNAATVACIMKLIESRANDIHKRSEVTR